MTAAAWTRQFADYWSQVLRRVLSDLQLKRRGRLVVRRREKVRPDRVIAVTGSCGKSTTVSLAGHMLSAQVGTLINVDNNTVHGVLKAMTGADASHRYWINEVSGHAPGEIARMTGFLPHDVAIVTTIGLDHFNNFRSREAVAAEKSNLVSLLPPDGIAILNADDPLIMAMADTTQARVVTFGRADHADIRLLHASTRFPERLSVTILDGSREMEVRTQLAASERWTVPVLASLALGKALGLDLRTCADAVEAWTPLLGRDSMHDLPDGSVMIADTKKAPYWTFPSSIDLLRKAHATRKTLVVGSISDYGGTARKKYMDVAREGLEVADRVIFVGRNSARVERLMGQADGRLSIFVDVKQASRFLRETSKAGDLVYLKGSRTDHLERIFLDRQAPISCWIDGCGMKTTCDACARLYQAVDRKSRTFPA